MFDVRRTVVRIVFAGVAVACANVVVIALYVWAMTARFSLAASAGEAFTVGAVLLPAATVGAAIVRGVTAVIGRRGRGGRTVTACIGGLLFALAMFALSKNLLPALAVLPSGALAGFLVAPNAPPPGRVGRATFAVLLMLAAYLLVDPAVHGWREAARERAAARSPLSVRIVGGALFGSELWLFDAAGRAVAVNPADGRTTLRARGGVAALLADRDGIWALQAPGQNWRVRQQPPGRFRLARYEAGRWRYGSPVAYAAGGRPIALSLVGGQPVIVAPDRLYLPGDGGMRERALSEAFEDWGQFVAADAGDGAIYLGVNRGEWGGSLFRISLATGAVAAVGGRPAGDRCSAPVGRDCEPVTGLAPDPERAGCTFVSLGVSHFFSAGRVVEVCGDRIRTVFERPVLPIGERIRRALSSRARRFPPQTEPVFGLVPAPGGFWGVTPRALYRWRRGAVERHALPRLEPRHGIFMAEAAPGVIAVATDVNAALSLSGATPLLFGALAPAPAAP